LDTRNPEREKKTKGIHESVINSSKISHNNSPRKFQSGGSTHFPIQFPMKSATLVHTDQSSQAPADQAITQSSPFQNNLTEAGLPNRIPPPLLGASLAFVVNGAVVESEIGEAVALSRFVREQLSADACVRS
jgi:hypothetical protein